MNRVPNPSFAVLAMAIPVAFALACNSDHQAPDGQAGHSGSRSMPQSTSSSSGGTSAFHAADAEGGTSRLVGTSSTQPTPVEGSGGTRSSASGGTASRPSGEDNSSLPVGGRSVGTSTTAAGGKSANGGSSTTAPSLTACDSPELSWRSANKTNYTSYPDPGSEECIVYNGCQWAGQFAACQGTKSEQWVSSHNIVAAFPDFKALELHDLCLRKGKKAIVVTVLDTCGDSDCDGCCTQNQGSADQLIDVESYTNERWGVSDGPIEWADLGPTKTQGCN